MASNAQTSAGTVIAVSNALPATHDVVGFEALSFDDVGEVTDLGEYGREYNLVTHNPLAGRRTVKRKGSFDDGSIDMELAIDVGDTGQTSLKTGLDSDQSYSFKVTHQDGNIDYFTAQIMSFTKNVGSVDQIYAASVSLEIDNDIVEDNS